MSSRRSLGESRHRSKSRESIISYLARVDPGAGEGILVGAHFGGWLSKIVVVGVASSEVQIPRSILPIPLQVVRVGLHCDRLSAQTSKTRLLNLGG